MDVLAQRQELAVLTEVSAALADTALDLPVVLDTIADLLVTHVSDAAGVYLLRDDAVTLDLMSVASVDPMMCELFEQALGGRPRRADDPGPIGRCFATRTPVVVNEIEPAALRVQTPEHYHGILERYPAHSLCYVPLMAGGDQLGVLAVTRFRTPHGFDDVEVDLVCNTAELTAPSIANAVLHERLAETTALFETAFAHAPIGMAIHAGDDGPSRFVRVNAALCDLLGRAEDALIGMPVTSAVDASDRELVEQLLAQVAAGELEEHEDDLLLLRADGSTVPAWISSRAVRSEDGRRLLLSQVQPLTGPAG
ncbi:MAG: GAF domain-containing protein [Acidimicrobiia bacterium]|nr:GAF domain-containing protein [Acidimicrobiia bacterium]